MEVGGPGVDIGTYVLVHRRQPEGSWKVDMDIFDSSRPPGDPAGG
jgi:hypothetical protein